MIQRNEVQAGLKAGAVAAGLSIAAAMAAGARERGDAWEPVNAISHMALGDDTPTKRGPDTLQTGLGLAGHVSALLGWGIAFSRLARPLRREAIPAAAAAFTAGAAAIDYAVVPKRFTPGLERVLTPRSVAAAYIAMAAGLATLAFLREDVNGDRC